MEEIIKKAGILVESLPYIHEFSGKTFVVKYGGSVMENEEAKKNIILDIIFMKKVGINPILVHGGGKKITKIMDIMGKKASFVNGYRVTDKETMDIVEMVLAGSLNKELVNLINLYGGNAVGVSGKDGKCIKARKLLVKSKEKNTKNPYLDIGFIGEVESIDTTLLNLLPKNGFIPVISSIGFGEKGETYNINADTLASRVACALKATKLILLTDVDGILNKKGKLIPSLEINEAKKLIQNSIAKDGMELKVNACIEALNAGVEKTHIIGAGLPHALLLEIFTQKGIGSEIVRNSKIRNKGK
ncbi:MAG: acetylglutamate kinase [Candidatus Firestonebacteria bacterium]|nr:acetylglutamate kinase [Candidatus Firestonebacteria bacterium]